MAPDLLSDIRFRRRLVSGWAELCRWDPALPADSEPPMASAVVEGLLEALNRPQPLAWGDDAGFAAAIDQFHRHSGDLEVAVAQLVCLREALRRGGHQSGGWDDELAARADMVLDRGMMQVVRLGVQRLKDQALLDELTGLGNRRALEVDLPAELSRTQRHGRVVAVVTLDLDGLKEINDRMGHSAGDEAIASVGAAIRETLREHDRGYRVGGDEFVVVLPETDVGDADRVMQRVAQRSPASFTYGVAVTDGADATQQVLDHADRKLIHRKRAAKVGR